MAYTTSNSDLPFNHIRPIAIGGSGTKWIGTHDPNVPPGGGSLVSFDGTNWTVYNTSNSGLPSNMILSIAIDDSGNKWIGTAHYYYEGGLASFDGTNWTVYNISNSGLPANWVTSIAIDGSGIKWIGTSEDAYVPNDGGIASFDGTIWTVYNTSNSGLPYDRVKSIAIEGNGTKWIGTSGGLASFDGTTWTVYNTSNSGLPANWVGSIAIDSSGNKWIGTSGGGLAVYNEGGVVSLEPDREMIVEGYFLHQNYPNPFNPITTIHYELPQKSNIQITIYNLLGRQIKNLINQTQNAGYKSIIWDATNDQGQPVSAGMYFYQVRAGEFVQTKKMILLR